LKKSDFAGVHCVWGPAICLLAGFFYQSEFAARPVARTFGRLAYPTQYIHRVEGQRDEQ